MSLPINRLILNPLPAKLLLILVIISGWLASTSMIQEHYPDLEIPRAMIITQWPGASPTQIERELTTPLENNIRNLSDLKTYSSSSGTSQSKIFVEFTGNNPLTENMQNLRAAVARGSNNFPSNTAIGIPQVDAFSMTNLPMVSWALHGNVKEAVLNDKAKQLKKTLEKIPEVKEVYLRGMSENSLHIRLIPDRLKALNISPLYILNQLKSANLKVSWKTTDSKTDNLFLSVEGQLESLESIEDLPILKMSTNRLIRLREVAHVSLEPDREIRRTYFSIAGSNLVRSIIIDVTQHSGTDTKALISAISAQLNIVKNDRHWPDGLKLSHITDESEFINQAFSNISSSLIQGCIIIFIILTLMLNWRGALMAALALPITILATLATMKALGYTLNIMVMIGIVLALGLMVDTFILLMEGIHTEIVDRKADFDQAILETARHFSLPVIAGQATTILALIPLMMISGIDGKFIRIIPTSVSICLITSIIVAFFICLPLSRYLLYRSHCNPTAISLIDQINHRYSKALSNWLKQKPLKDRRSESIWLIITLIAFAGSMLLASELSKNMYPQTDNQRIGVSLTLPANSTLNETSMVADQVSKFLASLSWLEKFTVYIGTDTPLARASVSGLLQPDVSANHIGFTLILTPKNERTMQSGRYLEPLYWGIQNAIKNRAGISLRFIHNGDNPKVEDPVQIHLTGTDYPTLRQIANEVEHQLKQHIGAVDVRSNVGTVMKQVKIQLNADTLSAFGISRADVTRQIQLATTENNYGTVFLTGEEEPINLRINSSWHNNFRVSNFRLSHGHLYQDKAMHNLQLSPIKRLPIFLNDGTYTPLHNLADISVSHEWNPLIHKDGAKTVSIFSKSTGYTADSLIQSFIPIIQQLKQQWPEDYDYTIGGEVADLKNNHKNMHQAFLLAMVLIYLLLSIMFNSLRQPLIILVMIPLAMTGIFTGFFLLNIPLSFPALIGLVSSIGIAVNNSIIMLKVIAEHHSSGKSTVDSAAGGVSCRLRPIVSTTLTTVLALIPLAFSDPQWSPLCLAIIFGLTYSTIAGFVVVPALYILITDSLSPSPR